MKNSSKTAYAINTQANITQEALYYKFPTVNIHKKVIIAQSDSTYCAANLQKISLPHYIPAHFFTKNNKAPHKALRATRVSSPAVQRGIHVGGRLQQYTRTLGYVRQAQLRCGR